MMAHSSRSEARSDIGKRTTVLTTRSVTLLMAVMTLLGTTQSAQGERRKYQWVLHKGDSAINWHRTQGNCPGYESCQWDVQTPKFLGLCGGSSTLYAPPRLVEGCEFLAGESAKAEIWETDAAKIDMCDTEPCGSWGNSYVVVVSGKQYYCMKFPASAYYYNAKKNTKRTITIVIEDSYRP
jgi:hypothetical protein